MIEAATHRELPSAIATGETARGVERLRLTNVSKTFGVNGGATRALADVNVSIRQGEFVTLIGPSGCGKSTLFNIVAGLLVPDPGGQMFLNGTEQAFDHLLGKVAFMPQRDLLLPWRTVLDNAILAIEIEGKPKRAARELARPMVREFGLGGFENHYPQQLSGGMRQRVALMRTFLFDRDLMLLDEPFGALDALTRTMMQRWLLEIWSRHRRTIIFVTHDIDEAIFLGDRVLVMAARPGRVTLDQRVPLPRPRDASVLTSPEFIETKRRLLGVIEDESLKTFAHD
jgi:ABC-type nitrate/sulfonate/bicarbonate transport system ATPase subunit